MADRRVTVEAVLVDLITNPLGAISRGFTNLGSKLDSIGSRLTPVTSGVASLVTAFVSLSGANRAIAAAEESVQAEARLARALQGRADAIRAVNEEATRIQSTVGISDDVLKGVAANLVTAGVAAADLPKFLRTAAGISRDLQIPIEAVAKSLANLDAEGPAGLLARFLPQLRQMKEDGKSSVEILAFLQEKFSDLEATDITIFERIRADQEALVDEGERIGLVLASVKGRIVELAVEGARRLADLFSSPEAKALLDILLRLAPAAAAFVAALAGLALLKTALTLLLAPLGLIFTVLGSIIGLLGLPILGPILLVSGAVAGIAALLGKFEGLIGAAGTAAKGVGSIFGESFGKIGEAFEALKEGRISVEEFFALVTAELLILGLTLKRNVFEPVAGFLAATLNAAKEIAKALFDVFPEPAGPVTLLERRDLKTGEIIPIDAEQKAAADLAAPPLGSLTTFANRNEKLLEAQKALDAEIAALRAKADALFGKSLDAGVDRAQEAAEKEVGIARDKNEKLLSDLESARARAERVGSVSAGLLDLESTRAVTVEQVRSLLTAVSETEREGLQETLTRRVTADFEAHRTSLTEFSALREEIEVGSAKRRIEEQEKLISKELEKRSEIEREARSIEEVIRLRTRELEIASKAVVNRSATATALQEIQSLRSAIDVSAIEVDVEFRVDAEIDRLENTLRTKDVGKGVAESITDAVRKARKEIEAGGPISPPVAFGVAEDLRGFDDLVSGKTTAAARKEIENLRAAIENTVVELPVQVRVEDALDKLERALNTKDVGKPVADSIEKALEELRKGIELQEPLVPPEAFDITEQVLGLEELTRKKREVVASDEEILARTKELSSLESKRRETLGQLLESANRENDAREKSGKLAVEQAKAEGKIREEREKAVEAAVKDVEAQRTALEKTLSGIEDVQLKPGGLSDAEAFAAQNAALEEFNRKLEATRDLLDEALALDRTGFAEKFDDLSGQLDESAESAERLALSFDEIAERSNKAALESRITAEQVNSELINQLNRIKTLEIQGIISSEEGRARADRTLEAASRTLETSRALLEKAIGDARRAGKEVSDLVSELERVNDEIARTKAIKADDFFQGIGTGVRGVASQFDSLARAGEELGASLTASLTEGLIDVFVKGEKSFQEFLGTFLQGISVIIARMLILSAISAATGGTGGVLAGLFAHEGGLIPSLLNRGGRVRRFNDGGRVSDDAALLPRRFAPGGRVFGPDVNRDVVPALLTPGEFVQTREAVTHYGLRVMEAIRARTIPASSLQELAGETAAVARAAEPRLQHGGPVEALQGVGQRGPAGPSGVNRSVVVSSEQEFERILAGGAPALMRFFSQHAADVRAALSVDGG